MRKIIAAADLGGTNFRVAGITENGEIVCREKMSTPRAGDGDAVVDAFVEGVKSKAFDAFQLAGVSFAVPGTVNRLDNTISNAPNVTELIGFPLAAKLEDRLGVPVVVENDANAAALGEQWIGAAKGSDNFLMITLGTGVGGGLVIDGNLVRGATGSAGEIGHFSVEAEGVECGCGSRGCIEQYASATAVARMAQEFGVEPANHRFTSLDAYRHALDGAPGAIKAFEKQGYYLGVFLGGMLNTLNPDLVVFGGGAADGWDMFINALDRELKYRAYSETYERAKLIRAALGDNAGIFGAARLGFEKIQS